MNRVAIIGGKRIPFVKSFGRYKNISLQELLTASLKPLVEDFQLRGKKLDEVIGGAVVKHSRDYNLTRESVLESELDPHTPAYDIQRACGTSLEATINIVNKIKLGQAQVGIAAGIDSNSDFPVVFSEEFKRLLLSLQTAKTPIQKLKAFSSFRPNHLKPKFPSVNEPRTGKSMGQHCEDMAKEWKISRKDQDQLALESQQKALSGYETGFYKDLLVPFRGMQKDQFVRSDTTLEKMSQLKPAFDKANGTLTAANSTPLTDGSSAVLLASEEYAQKMGWPILSYFEDAQAAAVDFVGGEGLLMAPTYAVSELLKRNNKSLNSFEIYEIHEAFAAQVLCTLKAWEDSDYCKNKLGLDSPLGSIDRSRMNLKGGSVALGHPFAATGARIVAGLAKQLSTLQGAQGLISICTAGGMGVTAILSSPK